MKTQLLKIASNTWNKLWTHFIPSGTASAGIIAIFMTIHLIKTIIHIIIQGYTLYAVYGWSIHLLGALWISVTYLLIHIARGPTVSNDIEPREIQLTEQDNSNHEKSEGKRRKTIKKLFIFLKKNLSHYKYTLKLCRKFTYNIHVCTCSKPATTEERRFTKGYLCY